ncbi:MAG: chorismate mutase [Oscillospiraceae bacterium]|nr:chorismate mutase [Oscillospiraceae bacterium]
MKCVSLEQVRENIDRIDNEIIKLIAERGEYVAQAAAFKKTGNAVRDSSRVETVVKNARSKAEQYGASPELVEAVYREMISRFIDSEMSVFKGDPS